MQNRFSPFDHLELNAGICFLSAKKSNGFLPVFPAWMIERYGLQNRSVALPDGRPLPYQGITLPVCSESEVSIQKLQQDAEAVFNRGFSGLKQADEVQLFQFTGLILYGFIWHELRSAMQQEQAAGSKFSMSHSLLQKFANLHMMLQSLLYPTEFDEPHPWSVQLFQVQNEPGEFVFKDEISTLFFSLRAADFGLIMLMQDCGLNARYHKNLLDKIGTKPLHAIQFEELNARFLYSAYLLQKAIVFSVMEANGTTYIEAEPADSIGGRPLFETWEEKTYAQVLENFWKPWGYTLFEIRKNPENPKSFLLDEKGIFVESVKL